MVSATEAMVTNMATESAYTVWNEFVGKVRKMGNHPVQITGRKHLRTIMREVEGAANTSYTELEAFLSKLEPIETAKLGLEVWNRNYSTFEADIRAAHQRKSQEIARYTQMADKVNRLVQEIVYRVVEAVKQMIRFARFSASMLLLGNYYLWKQSFNLVTGVAQGFMN